MAEKRWGRITKDPAYYLKNMHILKIVGCLSRNANEEVLSPLALRMIEFGTKRVWTNIPPSEFTNIGVSGWNGSSGWDVPSRPPRMETFGVIMGTLEIVAEIVHVAEHTPIITLAA